MYAASANALADVERSLERAVQSDRLLLVVLGADWCHDSRALASRLQREPLMDVVGQHYELVFVDAGFLDKGRAVMQRFGVAHYYATPTVLIVDPSRQQVINNDDRHQWGNAYNIDMQSSVEYFEKWLDDASAAKPLGSSARHQNLMAEIDDYEQHLASRVADGYAVVGPMLKAYEAGDVSEGFESSWNELRDFRMMIPRDIKALRDHVQRRVAAGDENIQLLFPTYPALSWEGGR